MKTFNEQIARDIIRKFNEAKPGMQEWYGLEDFILDSAYSDNSIFDEIFGDGEDQLAHLTAYKEFCVSLSAQEV